MSILSFLERDTMLEQVKTAFKDKAFRKAIIVIGLFIVINALKTTLYNYFLIPQVTKDIFVYKFWFTLLLCIIFYSIVLSFKSRYIFLVVFVLQGLYSFVNISYYLYYHSYLHFLQWISLFKEAMISASHLANPTSVQLLVVFIDIPFALYIFFKCYKPEFRKLKLPLIKYGMPILCLIILLIVEINNYSDGKSIVQFAQNRYYGETKIVERYGTVANSAINVIKNYSETKLIEQLTYGKAQTDLSKIGDSGNSNNSAIGSGSPNFVVIQVESMDSNIVKQKYKDSYVMPYLSSLRENSIYYPYMLSYHKGGGTSDTEFSIINSVESLDSFPAIKLTAYNYPNSIVSKLSKEKYSTMAFHGNVGTFYNRNIALSKMGFNKFYDISTMNYEDEGWGAPDHKVFSFAYNKMLASKQPFFSYIITMTSHGPFESARNYYNNERYDEIEDELVREYYNSLNYVDESLKDFVSDVQAKYSNTYFIIYGDHTPNISTSEYYQASLIEGDKYLEFVPLFIITPDNQKYTETSKVASFLDVAPTIMAASNKSYSLYSDGSNLLSQTKNFLEIPLKGASFNREELYKKISTYTYSEEEPVWIKYLPSFISSNLIEKHRNKK